YARLASSGALVKLSAKGIEPITRVAEDPAALRSYAVVPLEAFRISAVDIKNSSGSVKLRRLEDGWKVIGDDGKPQKADAAAVQDLLRALTDKRTVRSFPPPAEEAQLGFDKPDADAVSVWLEEARRRKPGEPGAKKAKKDKD